MKSQRLLTLFLCGLIFSRLGLAQTNSPEIGGYVKYMFSNAELPSIGRVNDHLLHSRLNGGLFLSEDVRFALEVRNRFLWGGSVEQTPAFLSTIRSKHEFWKGEIIWWNNPSSVGYSEVDRLWLDVTHKELEVTLGRQRIAWGTAFVWNPTDVFNPLSILDFDYEERPAVDAVRLQYYSSQVTKIEVAVKPGATSSTGIVAGKVLLNQWNYDFHLLGGAQGKEPFVGFAWAGDIAGAGFRGEIITKRIAGKIRDLYPSIRDSWSTTVVLSADYTFTDNTYLHSEFLYNSSGVAGNAFGARPVSQSLGLLSPARWSIFQELSFDIHPLVRVSGFVLYNPTDHSAALVPSVTWSALENLDISFFGILFSGNPSTEFGGLGESFFFRGKYSF